MLQKHCRNAVVFLFRSYFNCSYLQYAVPGASNRFYMKFFRLFVLFFAVLPSLALGMEHNTVICEGKKFDLSTIQYEEHREALKEYLAIGALNKDGLEYILDPQRVGEIAGFDEEVENETMRASVVFCPTKREPFYFCEKLSLASLNLLSVVSGDEDNTVMCEGEAFDLSKITFAKHKQDIKKYVARGMLKREDLKFILDDKRVERLAGFSNKRFHSGRHQYQANFRYSNPSGLIFWDNGIPIVPTKPSYCRKSVMSGAVFVTVLGALLYGATLVRNYTAETFSL